MRCARIAKRGVLYEVTRKPAAARGLPSAPRVNYYGDPEVTEDEAVAARVRVIYAMDRLTRLLDESGPALRELPEETLGLVLNCVNAISDVVERRVVLDQDSTG